MHIYDIPPWHRVKVHTKIHTKVLDINDLATSFYLQHYNEFHHR